MEFTPAEISAADEFRSAEEEAALGGRTKCRGGRNNRVGLGRRVEDAVRDFDARLGELYARRLEVEKCVLTEELKMRLLDKRLSDMDDLDLEEKKLT